MNPKPIEIKRRLCTGCAALMAPFEGKHIVWPRRDIQARNAKIVALYGEGVRVVEIAQRFGLSLRIIYFAIEKAYKERRASARKPRSAGRKCPETPSPNWTALGGST